MPVVSRSEVEHSVKTFVPGQCVRVGDSKRVGVPGSVEAPSQPRIKLIRVGEVVREIEVTCACGQLIRLKCAY